MAVLTRKACHNQRLMNDHGQVTRRGFLRALMTVPLIGAGVGLYTWRFEPHWLEVVDRRLPIAGLPDRLVGTRLAQLSDLHVGPRVDDAYILHAFDRARELSPEIIVYTGDFRSHEDDDFARARRVFPRLALGARATFGILGNHDYGPRWANARIAGRVADMARDAGVRMLRNEVAEVDGLQIAGLDDMWARRFDLKRTLGALDPRRPSLALSHNPDTADQPGWETYSGWILAGHTHGGQCKPPFLPPPLLPVQNRRYSAGAFALSGGRRMYVNRGIGHLIRVRFNVRPEITLFRLERA